MTPDVWYVAGNGLLVGAERRWLLLDDVPEEAFVATLWDTIAGSGVDRVLTLLESRYGDSLPSLAMIGAGREIARGSGEVTNDRTGVMLSLGVAARPAGGCRSAAASSRPRWSRSRPTSRPAAASSTASPTTSCRRVGPDIPVPRPPDRPARQLPGSRTASGDPHPTGTRGPRRRGRDDRPHPGVRRPDQRTAPADAQRAAPRGRPRPRAHGGALEPERRPAAARAARRSSSCCASTPTRR